METRCRGLARSARSVRPRAGARPLRSGTSAAAVLSASPGPSPAGRTVCWHFPDPVGEPATPLRPQAPRVRARPARCSMLCASSPCVSDRTAHCLAGKRHLSPGEPAAPMTGGGLVPHLPGDTPLTWGHFIHATSPCASYPAEPGCRRSPHSPEQTAAAGAAFPMECSHMERGARAERTGCGCGRKRWRW